MTQSPPLKLSICIATFNRAAIIGTTLERIISQATDECEIVVSDNASTDNTADVISEYSRRFNRLRYVRQEINNGLDQNFDNAVAHARGEYCWLLSDDDLLKPGAIATVLKAIRPGLSLIVVNVERCALGTSRVLLPKAFAVSQDRLYAPDEMDRLFADLGGNCIVISCYVIKRETWIARAREPYYGSLCIHVGVIFQEPLPNETLLIAEPLVSFQDHNRRSFWSQLFEILMVKWPALVWSLNRSEEAKEKVVSAEPWRNSMSLLLYRGVGWYSMNDYRRWIRPRTQTFREILPPVLIALLPGVLANTAMVLYYSVSRTNIHRNVLLLFLRESHFNIRNWRPYRQPPQKSA